MTVGAGVLRSAESLDEARGVLDAVADAMSGAPVAAEWSELRNLVDVGTALVASALARAESRGAHTRRDFLDTDPAFRCRLVVGP
jgi:L-aspartate oxidase